MSFTFKRWGRGQNRRESSGKKMSSEILGSGKKLPYLKNIYPWAYMKCKVSRTQKEVTPQGQVKGVPSAAQGGHTPHYNL